MYKFYGNQAIVKIDEDIVKNATELVNTTLFKNVIEKFIASLKAKDSVYYTVFHNTKEIIVLLKSLSTKTKDQIIKENPGFERYFEDIYFAHQFVENLYNFWRNYERYMVCSSNGYNVYHEKPYRSFNATIENVNDLVRKVYRDICENITGDHPKIYRQMPAGFQVGIIVAESGEYEYECLRDIAVVKQVLIEPPLILDPPMNTRSGMFTKVASNPLEGVKLNPKEWLCYPAIVGDLVIKLYYHNKFIGLGTALCNLFELSNDDKADAIYVYGLDDKYLNGKTVFYEDGDFLVGAISDSDEFGYFGYVKKMMLTLYNIIMMKKGRLPVHGAMVNVELTNRRKANIIIVGDTGTGKSETLEAFRILAEDNLREMKIIFDDMGSLGIKNNEIVAYGTEIGAFVRLDDLQPGFAWGNVDRCIIFSPQKTNARVTLPITTLEEIRKGYKIDYFLYANNYEQTNTIIKEFKSPTEAMNIFREGTRMAKGTTKEKGLVTAYFANIFGPVQYKELYEPIAEKYFNKMFDDNIIVGELRTKLGIHGYETIGPKKAAEEIMRIIDS